MPGPLPLTIDPAAPDAQCCTTADSTVVVDQFIINPTALTLLDHDVRLPPPEQVAAALPRPEQDYDDATTYNQYTRSALSSISLMLQFLPERRRRPARHRSRPRAQERGVTGLSLCGPLGSECASARQSPLPSQHWHAREPVAP